MRSFIMWSRQDKGKVFEDALCTKGWKKTGSIFAADIYIADHDSRKTLMDRAVQLHRPVFIHPHAARSFILWDGIFQSHPATTCNFVFAEGHKLVMEKYGYSKPIEVCGWTYCSIRPFQPSSEVKRVLFAPIHPTPASKLDKYNADMNSRAFEALVKLPIELTVRMYGAAVENGIREDSRVKYLSSILSLEDSVKSMQGYDVVVSHQTYAYLAVAQGIPTVMFGETNVPHSLDKSVKHWEEYKEMMMFPLDLLDSREPMEVLQSAVKSDKDIVEWRNNFIGTPFDSKEFVRKLEHYL